MSMQEIVQIVAYSIIFKDNIALLWNFKVGNMGTIWGKSSFYGCGN